MSMDDEGHKEVYTTCAGPDRSKSVGETEPKTKYFFSISKPHSIKPPELEQILPTNLTYREGESGPILILEANTTSDDVARFEVVRECNRIYFLTGEQLRPILTRKESNGVGEGNSILGVEVAAVKRLETKIERQEWTSRLAIQLHYWHLATEKGLDITLKIHLLFKIIESSFPDTRDGSLYPEYLDSSLLPAPRTESKLLRDLVSHQRNEMSGTQLTNYCRFLGRGTETFFDPTDSKDWTIIKQRLTVIEEVAKEVIDAAITRRF